MKALTLTQPWAMKRVYITFGGQAYDRQTALAVCAAQPNWGVDQVLVYDDVWLKQQPFYERNKWLWSWREAWGFGWNCWKAFIILDAMQRVNEPSVVLYVDGDTYPIADLSPIFEFAERDGACLFESQGNRNKRFTRRECFVAMGADEERYWDARHACGRFSAWSSENVKALEALHAWDSYLVEPACQGWHGSGTGDFLEFHRHSGDQSILTIIAEKYAFLLHREACQYGWPPSPGCGQPEDTYPQLFVQDGYRAPDQGQGSRFRNVNEQRAAADANRKIVLATGRTRRYRNSGLMRRTII